VREQQAAVIAAAARNLLAVIEHRLLHPVERAIGEHLFGMVARRQQRRIPRPREARRAPPRAIDGLRRDASRTAGEPDIAAELERFEELPLRAG
jgi:hypothetical protein